MPPSPSIHLRSALTSLKVQPTLMTQCCASSPTTKTIPRRFFISSTRPSAASTSSPHHTPSLSPRTLTRFESTAATPLAPSPSDLLHPLTWNAYLSLRKTRRRYDLASSLLSSLLTTAGGMSVLTTFNIEQINVFGLDPFLVLGLITAGSGAVGWLLGPFVGNAVFGMAHRRVGPQIAEKEKDFYRRIKKHRVDPSGGSSANPVPDYYGEKIGSVKGYRNWMKDQRAFNKRRQNFL